MSSDKYFSSLIHIPNFKKNYPDYNSGRKVSKEATLEFLIKNQGELLVVINYPFG
tara:strand:- start:635 stop:799 length:165 start_codon:yes stop_codon:yes gene_type:complete